MNSTRPSSLSAPTIWPVVQRELRAGSRKALNYWLRVGAAALALVLFYSCTDNPYSSSAQMGSNLFGALHTLLFCLLALMVPIMTADTLAQEKREGTLGLLFLTPLTGTGIVIGKSLAQALRAWILWLPVLPVLTIPFLLGGVTWSDVADAVMLELWVAAMGLAAGLIASTVTESRNGAIFIALTLTLLFLTISATYLGQQFVSKVPSLASIDPLMLPMGGLMLMTMFGSFLPRFGFPTKDWLWMVGAGLLTTLFFLYISLRLAAWQIERSWRDKISSPRQLWWHQRFCTSLFRRFSRRRAQRTLDWNPIAWLQQYSWKSRLSKWGLFLVFLLVTRAASSESLREEHELLMRIQVGLALILGLASTLVGISGFLTEKKTGALELILITPLRVNQIIFGRVLGLWKQFLPAAIVLAFFCACRWSEDDDQITACIFTIAFFSLPFFATYAALRVKYLFGAALLAWIGLIVGIAFALGLTSCVTLGDDPAQSPLTFMACTVVSYASCVGLTFFLLRHSLSRRIYSF